MSDKPAYRKGVRLSLTISPRASHMLDELLRTGLYGRSRAEVAQRLLYKSLQEREQRYFAGELPGGWRPRAGGRRHG